jgi:glycosyltransferase involved in cell wall biosynthesis
MAARHTVDLLTFLAPGDQLPANSPLYQLCRRIAAVPQPERSTLGRVRALLTSPLPDMALRLESQAMHKLVSEWVAETNYSVLQIEGIELAQYAQHANRKETAVIFDDHNCEYLLQQRNAITDLRSPRRWHAAAYSVAQWLKLRQYEGRVLADANVTVAVSQPDQAALRRIAPKADIRVAPNGINLLEYQPTSHQAHATVQNRADRFTLLFTGKMDYRPNVDALLWFADKVLPNLIKVAPEIHLQIVGMNPHARLNPLRAHPNIEITGAVADVFPYLNSANLYIIPMRIGGGTRFKALEAMAASKPIVSTTLGVEGIGVHNEQELLLADSPDEFTVAILRLISDQRAGSQLSRMLGENAHRFVAQHYTWETIAPIFEEIYAELAPNQSTH